MKHSNRESGEDELIPTRASLLARLKDWGDDLSWKDFFDTYWRLIYGRARRAGLSDQEAQEVVQETIIAVAKAVGDFAYDPARGSFKSWLYQLVSWRIADQFRRRGRMGGLQTLVPVPDTGTGAIEQIRAPDSAEHDAEWNAEWERNLLLAATERVKRIVSPEHFQIYDYHVLQERSVAETAQQLGTNPAKIYWVKQRVGFKLRRELEKLRKRSQ